MSNSQQHTTDSSLRTHDLDNVENRDDSIVSDGVAASSPNGTEAQRSSLTVADLAAIAATSRSTPIFQQNAARTLRTELSADAVLIVDYIDAFGGKVVRAAAGMDSVVGGSDLWLPEWLSPVDVSSPIKIVDGDPGQFSSISALGTGGDFRSAVAIAVPGVTGASGMVIALSKQPVDFEDSQLAQAQLIASLLSLSASRSNALTVAERDESQLAASRLITRSVADDSSDQLHPDQRNTPLSRISAQLGQFFDFDVVAIRVKIENQIVTREFLASDQNETFSPPLTIPAAGSPHGIRPIEVRASESSVAMTNSSQPGEAAGRAASESAWKSIGVESVLVIPIVSSRPTVVVLGSTRHNAYTTEATATANRFVPALTAAFSTDNTTPIEAISLPEPTPRAVDYVESIASATELVSACGVVATQIVNRTNADRVRVGFVDEESGRSHIGFDTEQSSDLLDLAWISPDEIERYEELTNDSFEQVRYASVRTPIVASERTIGFVEVTSDESGITDDHVAHIKEIILACSQVIATLRQLEQTNATLNKLEMLRRVTDQIRSERSDDPGGSPRIASLIRNLFDADWIYFGSVDHENDHSTTQITDGLDVPELAPGVRVSRRSLLIPSTLAVPGPVTVDLESAAPGQRAAGRWMY